MDKNTFIKLAGIKEQKSKTGILDPKLVFEGKLPTEESLVIVFEQRKYHIKKKDINGNLVTPLAESRSFPLGHTSYSKAFNRLNILLIEENKKYEHDEDEDGIDHEHEEDDHDDDSKKKSLS